MKSRIINYLLKIKVIVPVLRESGRVGDIILTEHVCYIIHNPIRHYKIKMTMKKHYNSKCIIEYDFDDSDKWTLDDLKDETITQTK